MKRILVFFMVLYCISIYFCGDTLKPSCQLISGVDPSTLGEKRKKQHLGKINSKLETEGKNNITEKQWQEKYNSANQ